MLHVVVLMFPLIPRDFVPCFYSLPCVWEQELSPKTALLLGRASGNEEKSSLGGAGGLSQYLLAFFWNSPKERNFALSQQVESKALGISCP